MKYYPLYILLSVVVILGCLTETTLGSNKPTAHSSKKEGKPGRVQRFLGNVRNRLQAGGDRGQTPSNELPLAAAAFGPESNMPFIQNYKREWFVPAIQDAVQNKQFPPLDSEGILDAQGVAKYDPAKLVVIGDLHGDMAALEDVLDFFHVGVLTQGGPKWTAEDGTVLVVLGDMVGRGPDSFLVVETLLRLRDEARKRTKCDVVLLLGNHECMNLADNTQAYMRYISDADLLHFATTEDFRMLGKEGAEAEAALERLRQLGYTETKTHILEQEFKGMGNQLDELRNVLFRRRNEQLLPGAPLGQRLHALHIACQIGPYVFTHAGMNKHFAALGVREINRLRVEQWTDYLLRHGEDAPPGTISPMSAGTKDGLVKGVIWERDIAAGIISNEKDATNACQAVKEAAEVMKSDIESTPVQTQIYAHSPNNGKVVNQCDNGYAVGTDLAMSKWVTGDSLWARGIGGLVIDMVRKRMTARERGFKDVVIEFKPNDWHALETLPEWYHDRMKHSQLRKEGKKPRDIYYHRGFAEHTPLGPNGLFASADGPMRGSRGSQDSLKLSSSGGSRIDIPEGPMALSGSSGKSSRAPNKPLPPIPTGGKTKKKKTESPVPEPNIASPRPGGSKRDQLVKQKPIMNLRENLPGAHQPPVASGDSSPVQSRVSAPPNRPPPPTPRSKVKDQ